MSVRWIFSVFVFGMIYGFCGAGEFKAVHELLGQFEYTPAAAEKWEPIEESKKISSGRVGGIDALKIPVNFAGTKAERAYWDLAVELDLSMCRGLQLSFYSEDVSNVSNFTMYFHSVDGWYRCDFMPNEQGKWEVIRINKNSAAKEGNPGGWDKVDRVRLSAWRGKDVDSEFYISGVGMYGTDAKVVILRNDSVITDAPGEYKSVREYCEITGRFLERSGLTYFTVSDERFDAEKLKGVKIVVLPYNPVMPEKVVGEIRKYLEAGGKLLACYTLPAELERVVGIKIGLHIRQEYDGQFAVIKASDRAFKHMPGEVKQASWNIRDGIAVDARSVAAALWYDNKGKSTGRAAIVASDNCVYLSHVLLGDDADKKLGLLLSMLGHLDESVLYDAAEFRVGQVGVMAGFDGFESAYKGISTLAEGRSEALDLLGKARIVYLRSKEWIKADGFAKAISSAEEAQRLMVKAYCLAQRSLEGEHRAFWCHSAFGVRGMSWDEAIKRLAENGFTAVLPNMLWGGAAFYESEVLPVSASVKEQGDQIKLCVEACKKYGIECHVWKVNFYMGWATDADFAKKMKEQGRTQVMFDGSGEDRWLCPSHPENQRLEIDSMLEVAKKYDVDGVHFDYIRYPHGNGCFCGGCKERFEKWAGVKVEDWPSDVRSDDAILEKWFQFRREQITGVVRSVAEGVRESGKDVKISAAVFRDWPVDRNTVGQDWKLWCERGYLDFVCPMDYTESSGQFRRMVENQLNWAGDVPCYPGIGLSVWGDPKDIVKLIEQINITRELKTGGFTVFNYGPSEAGEIVGQLGLGMTVK